MAKFIFLFALLICAAQMAAKSPLEKCLQEQERECIKRLIPISILFGRGPQGLPAQTYKNCATEKCAWLNALGRLKRKRRSEDLDIDGAIRLCVKKLEDNQMMAAMYSRERMEAICRVKVQWLARVSGMTREDQQQKMDSMSPGAWNYFSSLGTSQGQSEVNQGQSEVNEGQSEVDQGQSAVNQGQSEVNQGQSEVNQGQIEVNQGQSEVNQGQSEVNQGQQHQDIGQDPKKLTLTDKSKMMEDGKEACMKRTKKMMTGMISSDQMESVCGNEMKWVVQVEEARRRDPSMRSKVESMAMPVRNYFNSLGEDRRQKRQTSTSKPRKEYRMLTAEERRDLHDAFNAMKNTTVGGNAGNTINAMKRTLAEGNAGNISEYYVFVMFHQTDVSPAAHFGPSFLGWHREFLMRMERALQRHNPSVMLPYWDSTLDGNLGDSANSSVMWTPEFMGTAYGQVVTGPFANWETLRPTEGRDGLWRTGGAFPSGFYTNEAVDLIVGIDEFRENTQHVNPFVEGVHGGPHVWVGGPMSSIENSPSDPIFWMHHAFVDMLWELQQQRIAKEGRKEQYVYPSANDSEAYGVGPETMIDHPSESFHYLTNPMLPFDNLYNVDGLRDTYRFFYHYTERPSCSKQKPTCGSPYLFCIDDVYMCAPKLQLEANCQEFESSDSCFEGICEDGVCVKTQKCY